MDIFKLRLCLKLLYYPTGILPEISKFLLKKKSYFLRLK